MTNELWERFERAWGFEVLYIDVGSHKGFWRVFLEDTKGSWTPYFPEDPVFPDHADHVAAVIRRRIMAMGYNVDLLAFLDGEWEIMAFNKPSLYRAEKCPDEFTAAVTIFCDIAESVESPKS